MLRMLVLTAMSLGVLGFTPLSIRASEWSFQGYWGGAGEGPGEFHDPRNLAVGPNDNVYVADTGHGRIQQFDAEGHFIRSWGASGEDAAFGYLKSVEIGLFGDVYALDGASLQKFTAEGVYIGRTQPGETPSGYDVAIDANGNLYSAGSRRLYVYDAQLARVARIDGVNGCVDNSYGGVAIVGQRVHLLDSYCQTIDVYTPSGGLLESWSLSNLPSSFSLATSGDRFFLTSPTQRAIRILNSGGIDSGESITMPEIEGTVPIPMAVTVHNGVEYVLADHYVLMFAGTTAVEKESWGDVKSHYR